MEYTHYKKRYGEYVEGVREHGDRRCYELELPEIEAILTIMPMVAFHGNMSLNEFEDGFVCLMTNQYDLTNEEWREQIIHEVSDLEALSLKAMGYLDN